MSLSAKAHSVALRYANFAAKRPFVLLGGYLLISIGCILLANFFMEIRTDLESLLPTGSPSVVALEESRARSGSTDFYVVAVTSPDPEANIKFVKDMKAKIEKWEETNFIQIDRDPTFFTDHALLYLPEEDLERLRDKLKVEIKTLKRLASPMYVNLRNPEERAEDERARRLKCTWLAPDLAQRMGLDDDTFGDIVNAEALGLVECTPAEAAAAAERRASGGDGGDDDGFEDEEGFDDPKPKEPPRPTPKDTATPPPAKEPPPPGQAKTKPLPPHLEHYLISADGEVAVLMANLSVPATDVVKSREVMDRGAAHIEALDVSKYHPEMRASIGGAYQNFKEVESISNDSTVATLASIGFVLLVLISFFRNARSVILLVVPLAMGIIWSVGLTTLTFGHLNISTLFVFSMLIGMGIDFGIHYYSRILEEYRKGSELPEAIATATVSSGRAMLSAAITTVAALLTLLVAHFQGFIEFGIIASCGIALCLAAAILVMPPTIFALERMVKTKRPDASKRSVIFEADDKQLSTIRLVATLMLIVGVGAGAFAAYNWDKASFEHNFRNLRGPSSSAGISYGKAVGRKRNTSGAMILGESQDQMRDVHAVLSDRLQAEDGAGYLKSFITIETYVPPRQNERMAIIEDIGEMVNDKKLNRSKGKSKKLVDRMRELSNTKPFTIEQVPRWAKRAITEKDGSIGKVGILYSTVKKWDASDVQRFQNDLGVIETEKGDKVLVASSGFILSDVIRVVKEDALRLLPIVFAVLFFVLLIDLRTLKGTLVCLLTMGVALLMTIGGMILFDIKLGLYNMIVLPMVLGTGIDGSIHIYHRYREVGSRKILYALKTTGLSVVASSMTTLGGFLGLLFVQHKGVATIGWLAVTGIAATLIAIFLVLPGLLLLFYGKEQGHDATGESGAEPQAEAEA